MTPVMAGKIDPPTCPRTNTNTVLVSYLKEEMHMYTPSAEERISTANSFDATEMPYSGQSSSPF